jgi:GTP pyrophosphokinase
VQDGRELLDKDLKRLGLHQLDLAPVLTRLRYKKLEDLHVAVALGDVGTGQVARILSESSSMSVDTKPMGLGGVLAKPPKPAKGFTIEGVGNLMAELAQCCQPVAGDAIAGYLTRGRGVTVHRTQCKAFKALLARSPERIVPVEWGREGGQSYSVDIVVRGWNRKWLLKDLTTVIGTSDVHILAASTRVDEATNNADIHFTLKVTDFAQLGDLLGKLEAVPGVSSARRPS